MPSKGKEESDWYGMGDADKDAVANNNVGKGIDDNANCWFENHNSDHNKVTVLVQVAASLWLLLEPTFVLTGS